jgi:hypothetical protein
VVSQPALSVIMTHIGNFAPRQTGATYTVLVSSSGIGPTDGTPVVVTEKIPAGLHLKSMAGGPHWTCDSVAGTCMQSDPVASGTTFDPITVTVDVDNNASSPLSNQVSVSGGGAPMVSATDLTTISRDPTTISPFGSFDTPLDKITNVVGAIPVTGWALATNPSASVSTVEIYRDPVGSEQGGKFGLVFIGNATFVKGARPDVQALYPNYTNADRAGWGYQMLTNFLPANDLTGKLGNGTYRIHAIAYDSLGNTNEIGAPGKTFTVDNSHAVKPFGTIDTPGQGGTVAGSFINFAWALTPQPKCIPTDGSTISVVVDSIPVGTPVYNQYRNDIANLFPNYCNSNGAIGYFMIDTTKLTNGVHTISWNVFDDGGSGEGIGSRYFTVANGAQNVPEQEKIPIPDLRGVRVRHGFAATGRSTALNSDRQGFYQVEMEELDRIELEVGAQEGYQQVNGERQELPVGSTLKGGVFYWQAGPGFLGDYELVFVRSNGLNVRVYLHIGPKTYSLKK